MHSWGGVGRDALLPTLCGSERGYPFPRTTGSRVTEPSPRPRVPQGRVWGARGDTALGTFSAPRGLPSPSAGTLPLPCGTPIHVDATPASGPGGWLPGWPGDASADSRGRRPAGNGQETDRVGSSPSTDQPVCESSVLTVLRHPLCRPSRAASLFLLTVRRRPARGRSPRAPLPVCFSSPDTPRPGLAPLTSGGNLTLVSGSSFRRT